MSADDWGWVNWYATRRHLVSDQTDYRGNQKWSLCGTADVTTIEKHAEQRKRWTDRPKDYDAIPRCKFCERKAGTA